MSLVALITLVVLILRSRSRGVPWLMAILAGVKRALLGVLAAYGLIVVLAMGLAVTDATLRPVSDTVMGFVPDGQPPASHARQLPATLPTRKPEAGTTRVLPTPTPRVVTLAFYASTSLVVPASTPVPHASVALPTSTPLPVRPASTSTPTRERAGCDPAYPDARTCIPPGPLFDQGCAITDARRFTVLPPDPQGLDHDDDGIGCEPVT